jgi:hypothetical protein
LVARNRAAARHRVKAELALPLLFSGRPHVRSLAWYAIGAANTNGYEDGRGRVHH